MTAEHADIAEPAASAPPDVPARAPAGRGVTLLFALTGALSAALVFSIQPLAAKLLLGLLGGSASVWNTALVFFQAVLLAGYALAHVSLGRLGVRRQPWLQLGLLALGAIALPIALPAGWTPSGDGSPAVWVLAALALTVGAPYLAVTTLAPVLQRWFAALDHPSAGDPYFLYAASNAGSFAGLLAYPLAIEPAWDLAVQGRVWALGYAVLGAGVVTCMVLLRRHGRAPDPALGQPGTMRAPRMPGRTRLVWVACAAVPSAMVLATTTHLTTDIAPVPLLWVVPLAVFLASFVLAFSRAEHVTTAVASWSLPVLAIGVGLAHLELVAVPLAAEVALHLMTLAAVATSLHGRLAASRPPAASLTGFYLLVSTGGVLGGAAVALVAPVVFDRVSELPILLVAALLLRPVRGPARRHAVPVVAAPALVAAVVLGWAWVDTDPVLHVERTFFGVHEVYRDSRDRHVLLHGTTVHGYQSTRPDEAGTPLAYYHPSGVIGQTIGTLLGAGRIDDVAVVGLGTGGVAAWGQPGQSMTFYEIDPAIVDIAQDSRLFTYVADSRADIDIVLGDGRLRLSEVEDHHDLILMDAFSSNAVPTHLMTVEAVQTYLGALAPGGVIGVHVSNRHLYLEPVVAAVATELGLAAIARDDFSNGTVAEPDTFLSHWVLLARDEADLAVLLAEDERWYTVTAPPGAPLWTDSHSSLWGVIDWR